MTAVQSPRKSSDPISPLPGENQADFLDRVFRTIPGSTDHRTAVAHAAWANSGRDAEIESIVRRRFPAGKFVRKRNRPVFVEHTKARKRRDPDTGEEREILEKYDRDALAAIVDRCNERILDTGDLSPLIEGHTPDPDDLKQGVGMPDVLGYSGPFRLGRIGNVNPRYAIFSDEFQHADAVDRLERLTRRSPEVWLEDRMDDRFFDPIAALGAETPRLDTGLGRFGRLGDRVVEKYTAAAVSPAGHNAFIPSDGGERKRAGKYAGDDPATNNGDGSMLSPEDVKQIVDAIEQLDWVQGVKDLLSQQGAGEPIGMDTGDMAPPELPSGGAPAAGLQPAPPMPGDTQHYECDHEDTDMMSRYMSGEVSDDEVMEYMSGRKSNYAASVAEGSSTDPKPGNPSTPGEVADRTSQYSRENGDAEHDEKVRYHRLERENAALKQRMDKIDTDRRDQYRRAELAKLQAQGFALDLDTEVAHVSDMTDDQFTRHLTVVERYEKAPLDVPQLYTPALDPPETDKYKRDRTDGIKALALEKGIRWAEAEREYDKQHATSQVG